MGHGAKTLKKLSFFRDFEYQGPRGEFPKDTAYPEARGLPGAPGDRVGPLFSQKGLAPFIIAHQFSYYFIVFNCFFVEKQLNKNKNKNQKPPIYCY